MILAIDIGNTNIVAGGCLDSEILFSERISTNHTATVLEYSVSLKNVFILNNADRLAVEGAIISSVVPSVTGTVAEAVMKITGKKPLIIGKGVETGLSIHVDNPASFGSDLIVDSVAGISEYPVPLAIIDMGTATTVSIIDRKCNCIGGMIIPGIKISLDSLIARTAQLPKISLEAPEKVISKNTADCIKSGVIFGAAAMLDGVLERMEDELGQKLTAVATGGLAELIVPNCRREIILDRDLLLKGLMKIYNMNSKRGSNDKED